MAQCGHRTSYQQRIEIGERAAAGICDGALAEALGCSIWTVRKWRRAYERQGRAGLVSHLGRPPGGALASCSQALRERIAQLRCQHPGWGAPSILDYLQQEQPAGAAPLPSRARVAAFLKERGLTRRYERHGGVKQPAGVHDLAWRNPQPATQICSPQSAIRHLKSKIQILDCKL